VDIISFGYTVLFFKKILPQFFNVFHFYTFICEEIIINSEKMNKIL